MKVTTADLLKLIVKAQKVSPGVDVKEVDDGYSITVYCAWLGGNNFYTESAFISDKGESVEFYEFSDEIDYQIKLKEEREIKHQRRQEVLSRLSDEDKELLALKG